MKFYHYRQNNSGGMFVGPQNVIVEANSPNEADLIAENSDEVDIYFDGCNMNMDCSCCGDRWYRACDYDECDLGDYPQAVVIRHKDSADLHSSKLDRQIAADLLSNAGFGDVAEFLRKI